MKNLQTMKHSVQKGFTLIELMIVVAIIGILAALAIPAYTDYTIKSRVGEGASLSGALKTGIEVYWSENGTMADSDNTVIDLADIDGTSPRGEYVSSILLLGTVTQPYLEVNYKTSAALGTASASCVEYFPNKPSTAGGNLIWTVRSANGYTTKGGISVAAAACTTNSNPTVDKYRPKS